MISYLQPLRPRLRGFYCATPCAYMTQNVQNVRACTREGMYTERKGMYRTVGGFGGGGRAGGVIRVVYVCVPLARGLGVGWSGGWCVCVCLC